MLYKRLGRRQSKESSLSHTDDKATRTAPKQHTLGGQPWPLGLPAASSSGRSEMCSQSYEAGVYQSLYSVNHLDAGLYLQGGGERVAKACGPGQHDTVLPPWRVAGLIGRQN